MKLIVKQDGTLMQILTTTQLSRNKIKSLLKYRLVSINGRPTSAFDAAVFVGDVIKINKAVENISNIDIIYENNQIIVINKPDRLLSVSTDNNGEDTAYKRVTEYVSSSVPKNKSSTSRVFIVHRLDRDTSGVLLFAKNEQIKIKLQENWNNIVSARNYYAIVEGNMPSGRVESWLTEDKNHRVYSSQSPNGGKLAITEYDHLKEKNGYSLMDVALKTGKKNQIRAQFSALGYPVAGDKKYDANTNPLKRLGLHAYKLELTIDDEKFSFECKIPHEFKQMLR